MSGAVCQRRTPTRLLGISAILSHLGATRRARAMAGCRSRRSPRLATSSRRRSVCCSSGSPTRCWVRPGRDRSREWYPQWEAQHSPNGHRLQGQRLLVKSAIAARTSIDPVHDIERVRRTGTAWVAIGRAAGLIFSGRTATLGHDCSQRSASVRQSAAHHLVSSELVKRGWLSSHRGRRRRRVWVATAPADRW